MPHDLHTWPLLSEPDAGQRRGALPARRAAQPGRSFASWARRCRGAGLAGLLAAAACAAPPPPAAPTGIQPSRLHRFEGEILQGGGRRLHFSTLLFADPTEPGGYLGTIDIPLQALRGAALSAVVFSPGERVGFGLPVAGSPRWVAVYDGEGRLACEFKQHHVRLPCTLREVATAGVAQSSR